MHSKDSGRGPGTGPYARNDVKLSPDPRVDESGNIKPQVRRQRELPYEEMIEANSDFAKKLPKY